MSISGKIAALKIRLLIGSLLNFLLGILIGGNFIWLYWIPVFVVMVYFDYITNKDFNAIEAKLKGEELL